MSTLQTTILKHPDSTLNNIQFDNDGRVGVQTSTPVHHLHVNSVGTSVRLGLTNFSSGSSGSDGCQLQYIFQNFQINNKESGYIEFLTADQSRMQIGSDGKIGIGTSSIDGSLHVKGAGTHGSFVLEAGGTSGTTNQIFIQGHNHAGTSLGEIHIEETATNQGALVFKTNGGSVTDRMRISAAGVISALKPGSADQANLIISAGGAGDPATEDPRIQFAASGFESAGTTEIRSTGSFGNRGLAFYTGSDTAGVERLRIQKNGYINAGINYNAPQHRFNGIDATVGTHIFTVSGYQPSGGVSQDSLLVYSCDSGGVNGSTTGMAVQRTSTTGRSINAAGTINASGADYAEYMTKAGNFTLAKGDICGINSEGKLTNIFDDAIGFVVKSTKPSYVGGDSWHEAIGEAPGGYGDDRTEEEIAAAKVVYQEALETARQQVDRIAFSGQVPVNVTGTTAGQYIIPAKTTDGGITGEAKNEADLTIAEYMQAVGKVIGLENDGRAKIIVKVA